MWFGELYTALEEYVGDDVVRDVLLPRVDGARTELMTLTGRKSFDPSLPAAFAEEESWNWYALSRVYDWLTLDAQRDLPGAATRGKRQRHARTSHRQSSLPYRGSHSDHGRDDPWDGPHVDMHGVSAFLSELGFWQLADVERDCRTAERRFHPFFHEIVDLVEDAGAKICTLSAVVWPGWMWGDMMFARAGVVVRCPPGMFRRELAIDSTLYFAYDRLHRPTNDRSHGWGHNSQWRTEFRRDYALGDAFFYNVDGKRLVEHGAPVDEDEQEAADSLSVQARIELLRHRSLVASVERAHDDLYPYDDRHVEPRHETRTRTA